MIGRAWAMAWLKLFAGRHSQEASFLPGRIDAQSRGFYLLQHR
jgi:hypothetical protein